MAKQHEEREYGPALPPPIVKRAEISPQRCFLCACKLEVLEECFIHKIQPVAVCLHCADKVQDKTQLAPAVVAGEADAEDLAGNEITRRYPGRDREGEERVA